MRRITWPLLAAFVALTLAALGCGGGATPAPASSAKPAAPQAAAPAPQPAKPAAEPAKPVAQPAKPAAEPAKPAAQPAKPAAAAGADPLAGQTLRIAILQPLTGPQSQYGIQNYDGSRLAADDITAMGGVKVELVPNDTTSDKTQASALIRKIAADKTIIAILGPSDSNSFIPGSDVAAEVQIMIISPGSVPPWPKEFNEWTFRTTLVAASAIPRYVPLLKEKLNIKTAAIMYDSANDAQAAEARLFQKTAQDNGLTVTAFEAFRTRDTDFSAQLTKILASPPDALAVMGTTNEAALVIQQARQRNFKGEIVGASGLNDPTIFRLSNGAAKGATTYFPFNPDSTRPEVKKFVEGFTKKFNRPPSNYNAYGYDSVFLVLDAARRAKSTTDRKAVRDAFGSTKDFKGVTGSFSYNGKGDNQTPVFDIFRMEENGYTPLK